MRLSLLIPSTAWHRIVVAPGVILVAAALRVWPLESLQVRVAWLTFYPAVMVAAVYGGLYAGLLATGLACLVVGLFWQPFVDDPFIRDGADALGMAVFVLTGTMISVISESMLRATARAHRAAARTDAVNKELEAFSYSVSHDLRAPLRSIDGFSQALLEDYGDKLDDEGRHYLERVRAGTQRMGQLIDDLLSLARVTRSEILRAPVDLSRLAESVVGELRRAEPNRNVETVIQPGLHAEADPQLLRILMGNLLSNAWKFSAPTAQPRIEFGSVRNGDGVPTFFVRDNGAGFDMAYAGKLFGAFQRLHTATEFPGTGIGLATVQRIVHRHGGQVRGEGVPGQGATFYFTLPT